MKILILTLSLALTRARCNVALWNQFTQLQPVQGLYVKPSADGTTGDLYVAASENNGAQWLTEQSLNLLPINAQQNNLPLTYAAANSHDENVSSMQKRAVFSPSPVTLNFGAPAASTEGQALAVPSAIQTSASTVSEVTAPKCLSEQPAVAAPAIPYPFPYFYPQMASLLAGALNAVKDVGEGSTSVAQPFPFWPQSYGLPIQYLMMDPSSWLQGQAANAAAPAASLTSTATTSSEKS